MKKKIKQVFERNIIGDVMWLILGTIGCIKCILMMNFSGIDSLLIASILLYATPTILLLFNIIKKYKL